ncbi:DUF3592 domain-containing protein [Nocardiopsis ansamitocini]|uniref:DUF3592 domain-containing protein n=1 Tax=Nocardiopsis ansamitocini TaxID=1670832 RepID=A0A9W6UIG1_9ACTN|nr:DUF3592 domain-containing protein [Nocardiopsis ansamitocini]GLU49906.1 hypothetical protein Nans01_42570 [Nocardiopsis ansamitocini]
MLGEQMERVMPIIMMLGIGGLAAVVGVRQLLRTSRLRSTGVRVGGTIVGQVGYSSTNRRRNRAAVFEFRTVDGDPVRVQQKIAVSHTLLRQGQPVTVAYDPADPRQAEIVEAKNQIGGAVLLITVGGLFFLVGAVILVSRLLG